LKNIFAEASKGSALLIYQREVVMRRLILLCLMSFLVITTSFAQTHFTATFTGDQQNPAVTTSASGTGVFLLTEAGLAFNITVDGLDFTAAHFHTGAPGANGGVVRTITNDFVGNTASGIWTSTDSEPLTDELLVALLSGNLYVNAHTAANPGGEIRGQVTPSAGTAFSAKFTGAQQNPAVTTDASGTGAFLLTDAGLAFTLTVEGLDFTAAHFHTGAMGANGGVVRTLTNDFVGNTASGIWMSTDSEPLTDELIAALLSGNLYVNVHTAANPGGEIRGQVIPSAGTGFSARFTGDQQNPPVTTDASGTGTFLLTDAGLIFTVTVEGLDFTVAHFHNAAAGVNGGVVRTITNDFVGNTATGIWRSTDSEPLTDELLAALLSGNLYVNAHTAANPGGEIRGQVTPTASTAFSAKFTGAQQNPAVTTDASGTGTFLLTDAGLEFTVTVEGLDFTAAHFHTGAPGANGGVVRTITNDFVGNTASGIWTSTDSEPLTDELLVALLSGNLYVNAHTAANPGGEIRGQVTPSAGTAFSAKFTGAQQNPAVTTDASGTGAFLLTDAGLAFTVTVEGLDFTAAHFHTGAMGANGGVVRTLTNDFVGNTATGIWMSTDSEPLTDELVAALLSGNLYVNVHTAANPGGEIRGQVNLSSGTGFAASLDGKQEGTPVTTGASGTGAFTLANAGLVFNTTVTGLDFTAAHFHNAAAGVNGGVVRTMTNDFVGNTASGVWTSTDSEPLTNELIGELLQGNIYVNAHTVANPGGEIRGQLSPIEIVTSVELVDGSAGIPTKFNLFQNFPNPFNPATEIRFDLKQAGPTVLKIYNMLGRVVATLVDEDLQAGAYKITFEATDLPSGVYTYRLETQNLTEVRKMILLR
jgi:uncharacterized membrane-anchored protein